MKKIFQWLILIVFLVSPIQMESGREVTGLDVINTKPFSCVLQQRIFIEWKNDLGTLHIYNAKIWAGVNGGANADVGFIAYRKSDKSILFHGNWDRYAEPTSLNGQFVNLDLVPNYMILKQGDSIQMVYWCDPFNEQTKQAHLILTIWFSKE